MVVYPRTELQLTEFPSSSAFPEVEELFGNSSRPLSIAVFSDSLLPLANGVSVSINILSQALRAMGHTVDHYAPEFPGHTDVPEDRTTRFPSVRLPWADGYPITLIPVYPTLKKFRQRQYDLIHTHTIGICGFAGMRWARSHEIPLVASYHTLYDRYAHYCTMLPRRYVRYKIARHTQEFFNEAAHVITPSRFAARWLQRHDIKPPVSVIRTGTVAPPAITQAEARRALGIPLDKKILISAGRIVAEKNLDTVMEACQQVLKDLGPECEFWLVGDGPYRPEIEAIAKRSGLTGQIRWVGIVPPQEIYRYYAAADLFVFGSVTETQGLVVQEAMSLGVPAVVVKGGGASATITHGWNGYIALNRADALAETIQEALEDANLKEVGMRAKETAIAYGQGEMAQAVVGVYRQVLGAAAHRTQTTTKRGV